MRTFATITRNAENAPTHRFAPEHGQVAPARDNAAPVHFFSSRMIQRNASSAHGGGRPSCQSRLPIQAKLRIGASDDKYEKEADRLAEQVMRMPEPNVQRKACSACSDMEEDERIQAAPLIGPTISLLQRDVEVEEVDNEEETIRPKAENSRSQEITPDLESRIRALKGA
ncbi:MAG: hypothetical protein GY859_07340, partial [Desulfobacterales bacterium]|nr:hypothetical protein [Desulfobacterales bacterium]